ncbi:MULTISPECIES: TIGR00341 family protein [Haloarcula]|uniref:TIGR00341 family protein n=1 Tax=Haloarcula pellucida TaxID=1427151 RepID=A0A830GIR8_9EURY|nr:MULTISPECIES: TIGR00341 family protein [Halomicroarcula]MBX0346878.1 TIGR00341 family protein [Halomicroarcula pellucida]MDS0277248.1 TIGR00341 family protein [Halomicroarcula sp. S1AR25-4]GGN85903.1 TIGR00341 family protein [Halomicroarcula pellucida]
MRLIQIRVEDGDLDTVRAVLDDREISYVQTDEESAGGEASLIQFPIPPEAVDEVFEELESAGLDPDRYAVVATAETARPDQSVAAESHADRISHDELRGRAVGMNPGAVTYYGMTILSAVVATAGLLLDSPAIVVGSMVIAPQVGSALIAAVGTTLDDRLLVKEGFRDQLLGLLLAVASAATFGFLVRHAGFVPGQLRVTTVQQIAQRISPGFLSLAVGLCAGAAGAVGLATALPVSLVGVMIAAALIPAAAAVGVGIAWGLPAVALGAGILLLVNAASINLTGFLVLWGLGFRPRDWGHGWPNLGTVRQYAPTVMALLVLLATFAGASTVTVRQMQVETSVNDAVEETLADESYEDLRLLSVRTRFGGVSVYRFDREVTVQVSRPDDTAYPRLATRLEAAVTAAIAEESSVEVTFVDRQTAR